MTVTKESNGLLLVDDDAVFREVLARALERRGFAVSSAGDPKTALEAGRQFALDFAVVDLCLGSESGLALIEHLLALNPSMRIVVLTGYASVATAVEAIKLGAKHYLTKPTEPDEIVAAFQREEGDSSVPLTPSPLSVRRLEWEYIQKVLRQHEGNVSAAARALGMHRRTLQRKLRKHPTRR